MLELPAGKLDHPGEEPLECAKRELAEEVGRAGGDLARRSAASTPPPRSSPSSSTASSPRDLAPAEGEHEAGEDEDDRGRPWPLADLDGLIDQVRTPRA